MKYLIVILGFLASTLSQANERGDMLDDKYACQYKIEEYANNSFNYEPLANFDLEVQEASSITLMTKIVEQTIALNRSPYFVRVSGFGMKPGNKWLKGQSNFLVSFEFIKNESGRTKVLDKITVSSDELSNPKDLEGLKEGKRKTRVTLHNTEYLTDAENKEAISPTTLTSVDVACDIKRSK